YMRLIIISNEEQVIDAARDERRYFVLETADTFAQQAGESESAAAARRRQHFDPISRQMMHEGGAAAMMSDLLRRDIRAFAPRVFPDTPFLAQQKALSRRAHEQWLAAKLGDDGCSWFDDDAPRSPSKKDVYRNYASIAPQYDRRSP